MDRLVELFLESARPEGEASAGGPAFGGGAPDAEAVERGVAALEKMLSSEDAAQMGGSPSATFVCLGMALEEKPKLGEAAIRCFEKALEHLERRGRGAAASTWERCVVLQQLGAVCQRQQRLGEADRWLGDCAEACSDAEGHPRDAVLFQGAFSTKQTHTEFASMVEKLRAKTRMLLGDETRAREHVAKAMALKAAASGDAVERVTAGGAGRNGGASKSPSAASSVSGQGQLTSKELWAAEPRSVRQLSEYRYADDGSTVLLLLELNEHLGIGAEASSLVHSLQQFRVNCEPWVVDVQLRLVREDGGVWHFRLLLQPLAREIVPEDTVPRLRGKEGRKRLEVKLFKRDKLQAWFGDLVAEGRPKRDQALAASVPSTASAAASGPKARRPAAAAATPSAPKGSQLNPLSDEELACLPRPPGGDADNRPSTWQPSPAAGPAAPAAAWPAEPARAAAPGSPAVRARAAMGEPGKPRPSPVWVAAVGEELLDGGAGVLFSVRIDDAAGEDLGLQDLALEAGAPGGGDAANAPASVLQLRLLRGGRGQEEVLELRPPKGTVMNDLSARWKRKARVLEIRIPWRNTVDA